MCAKAPEISVRATGGPLRHRPPEERTQSFCLGPPPRPADVYPWEKFHGCQSRKDRALPLR